MLSNGNTALIECAERSLSGMAAILLGEGDADVDQARPVDGLCPLLIAAKRGDVAFTRVLLEFGVDLESMSEVAVAGGHGAHCARAPLGVD